MLIIIGLKKNHDNGNKNRYELGKERSKIKTTQIKNKRNKKKEINKLKYLCGKHS